MFDDFAHFEKEVRFPFQSLTFFRERIETVAYGG